MENFGTEMTVGPDELLASFLIGFLTTGAFIFGTYLVLENYGELRRRLFSERNIALYVLFGGFFAFIFQLADTADFVPLQAFAIGATWPAALFGYTSSQVIRSIGDAQFKDIKDLIDRLSS